MSFDGFRDNFAPHREPDTWSSERSVHQPTQDAGASGLTLVVPILNEREAVAGLEDRLAPILQAATFPLEILLVDDGSDDGSEHLLDRLGLPGTRVLRHPNRRGYGSSLATGIQQASHPWIAITDADGTYPDHRIPELFERCLAGAHDMLVGARTGSLNADPPPRRPPKWLIRRLASTTSGHPIPDLNSGLRIMRRAMVEHYLHLMPTGMSFTSTITMAALAGGWRVAFVPIDYYPRVGRSKFRPIADTARSLQLVGRAITWFRPWRSLRPPGLPDRRPHPDDAGRHASV
jgi:glycosyltransferase involved in cell wall biosynthesis